MNIVVVGGGKVGYYLIKTLLDRGHRPSLVEKDMRRCEFIASETGVLTINGDGTDLAALVDAGADTADALAAVTGRDEVNLVVCQLAKNRLGVGKVVARVNNPKNREVLQELGVDVAISSTVLIADAIEEEILWHDMRTILRLEQNQLSLVEITVPDDSPASGRQVQEVARDLPEGCVLVSVIRSGDVALPRGSTVIRAGDRVIAVVHRGEETAVHRALGGRRNGGG